MAGEEMTDPLFESDPDGAAESVSSDSSHVHADVLLEFWGLRISRRKFSDVKPDLDPLDVVRRLLEDFEHQESIDKSRSVAHLHRIIENTHARRRLEKWSLRVIALYLLIVLLIVIATYADVPFLGLPVLVIPPNVMVAILTTTTANIIGLGLIVLRGHFLARESEKSSGPN